MTRREMGGGSELLDWLAAECGCTYLSDLRIPGAGGTLSQAVKRIPWGSWPGEAWREAASYITGGREIPAAETEARAALARWLQKE